MRFTPVCSLLIRLYSLPVFGALFFLMQPLSAQPKVWNGKYGYIDKSGKVILAPRYDAASDFSQGLAAVKRGYGYGYIDQTGKMIVKPEFDAAGRFSDGLAPVLVGNRWRYIDKTGKTVIEPQFQQALPFAEGLALVRDDGVCGYIDLRGQLIINTQFEDAGMFAEGLAPVRIAGKWGYIDRNAKVIIAPQFEFALPFSEGLAPVQQSRQSNRDTGKESQYGFINKAGEFIVKPQFDLAGTFSNALAPVEINRRWGFIDKTGALIIAPQFRRVSVFSEEVAMAETDRGAGFIDKTGKFVIQPVFNTARDFSEGVAAVTQGFDLTKSATAETVDIYHAFITANAPDEDAFVAVQRVAESALSARDWEKAAKVFALYRPLFASMPHIKSRFDTIQTLLTAPDEKITIQNLGAALNSRAAELVPTPTADGKKMYFTSDRVSGLGREDVFVSELHQEGDRRMAEAPQSLGRTINSRLSEAVFAVSADENQLLLYGNYTGSLGKGDIFYSTRTAQGWSEVKPFPEPVNSPNHDVDAFLTSDGKAMLFVSDRAGTLGTQAGKGDSLLHGDYWGNTDIFISMREGSGWSKPVNLGSVINTPFAERTPFLHPDGKTLYFSSDGHAGLGHLDVYKTTRLREDSWTMWSEPVNLGKSLNTAGDDWGYKFSTDGENFYFSAERSGGFGREDIYTGSVPKALKPNPVATVQGIVTDNQGNALDAAIRWEELPAGKPAGELRSNPTDGRYFIILPLGKNYGYYASRTGYYPVSKNIDLTARTDTANRVENIVLIKIEEMKEKGVTVRINNIFFDFDKADLKPESYPELVRLAGVLKENQAQRVEIAGHTDSQGGEAYNLELSKRRAESVVKYLIAQGCAASNLDAKGYGKTVPLAPNETPEGQAQNRRVEFQFVK